MAELTGPNNCAECGTPLSQATVEAGDAGSLVIAFGDEMVEIPGLYICTNCAGAIMVGEKDRTVTPERAVEFLTGTYIPILAHVMTNAQNEFALAHSRFHDCKEIAEKLDPGLEVTLAWATLDEGEN